MRKLAVLAAIVVCFVLYGNAANACSSPVHATIEQTTTVEAAFYFEQAAPASHGHAHHNHRTHDHSTCDGACCGCAASAAVALPTSGEINHPAAQSASHRRQLSNFLPRRLTGDFYGPPKSFA